MDALILGIITLLTSAFTASVGTGGGLLLLIIMLDFMPVQAVIPSHAIVQFFSNFSRAGFGLKNAHWPLIRRHALGALIGGIIGYLSISIFPFEYLPLVLGGFILFMTWSPYDPKSSKPHGTLLFVGAGQTFSSFFVGATGPLSYPFLLRRNLDRHQVVITHACMMCTMHLAKVFGYSLYGFQLRRYAWLILAMSIGAIGGSYIGSKLRHALPEKTFRWIAKIFLTVLAIRMIVIFFL